MKLPTHRPCVSVIIFRPCEEQSPEVRSRSARTTSGRCREILLVHKPRKHDAWQIPQGGIEEGESIEEAARREIREETGIDLPATLETSSFHYQYDYPAAFTKYEKPKYAGQHLTFITATIPPETVVQVDHRELDAFQWIAPEDLGKYLKRKEYLEVVRKVIEEYESKGIRE